MQNCSNAATIEYWICIVAYTCQEDSSAFLLTGFRQIRRYFVIRVLLFKSFPIIVDVATTDLQRVRNAQILQLRISHSSTLAGGAENAELDIARLDNAAPYRKGGQRET